MNGQSGALSPAFLHQTYFWSSSTFENTENPWYPWDSGSKEPPLRKNHKMLRMQKLVLYCTVLWMLDSIFFHGAIQLPLKTFNKSKNSLYHIIKYNSFYLTFFSAICFFERCMCIKLRMGKHSADHTII
jgi:hypothetical protein